MEMETRVQAAKSITANNLPDRLDCAEAWFVAQRWVPHRIGRRLGTMRDQDGCLYNILGQLKGTLQNQQLWRLDSITKLTCKRRGDQACNEARGSKGQKSGHSGTAAWRVVGCQRRLAGNSLDKLGDAVFGYVVRGEIHDTDRGDTCQRRQSSCISNIRPVDCVDLKSGVNLPAT